MFRGNKPVLILPGILMVVMILGGYHFLQQEEMITNEQLPEVMEMEVDKTPTDDGVRVEANWDWTTMPEEGMYGEDYIGITVTDPATGKPRYDLSFAEGLLELRYGDQVIEEAEGVAVDNGIIFAFPNKVEENMSYGNLGSVSVEVLGAGIEPEHIELHFLHTWVEHSPLVKEDAAFTEPVFDGAANVPYWVTSY